MHAFNLNAGNRTIHKSQFVRNLVNLDNAAKNGKKQLLVVNKSNLLTIKRLTVKKGRFTMIALINIKPKKLYELLSSIQPFC